MTTLLILIMYCNFNYEDMNTIKSCEKYMIRCDEEIKNFDLCLEYYEMKKGRPPSNH
jgi:hypothetical protein